METSIIIYGKDGCPYTQKAREAYPGALYHNVLQEPSKMEEMLEYSDGTRKVPVIVMGGKVTIGFGGGS